MNKDNIKLVFLLSFIAISVKSLALGFDVASCLGMAISGSILFGYEWMSDKKEQQKLREEFEVLKANQAELLKIVQQVRSAQNIQTMNVQNKPAGSQISLNSPFPVRI